MLGALRKWFPFWTIGQEARLDRLYEFRYTHVVAYLSTFLFANPSFISGVAHIFDFEGSFVSYNRSRTPLEADSKAIYADWAAVGQALDEAVRQFVVAQGGKTL